jgi:hypothetical protein
VAAWRRIRLKIREKAAAMPVASSLHYRITATGQGGPMACESGAAGVWAALVGLAFFIASTVTVGYWLCVYHEEVKEIQPYSIEPCTMIQLIRDDFAAGM